MLFEKNKDGKSYIVGTIDEIAMIIAKYIKSVDAIGKYAYPEFKYALAKFRYKSATMNIYDRSLGGKISSVIMKGYDKYLKDVSAKDIATCSEDWFGSYPIKNKFNSEITETILFDSTYGGAPVVVTLWLDEISESEDKAIKGCIKHGIINSMKDFFGGDESYYDNVCITAEFENDIDILCYDESVEVCPYCGSENTFKRTELISPHAARCKSCGQVIMLCSECDRCDNCDWHKTCDGGECHYGVTKNVFFSK